MIQKIHRWIALALLGSNAEPKVLEDFPPDIAQPVSRDSRSIRDDIYFDVGTWRKKGVQIEANCPSLDREYH